MADLLISNDFRRTGTEIKRMHDQKAKWAYGNRNAYTMATGLKRPAQPASHYVSQSRFIKRDNQHNLKEIPRAAKQSLRFDLREFLADPASHPEGVDEYEKYDREEDTKPQDFVPAPEEDTSNELDVTGHAMLSDAVNKAVEQFESKETEKIAKEYEFVGSDSEDSGGSAATVDDFEVVEL